MLAVPFLASGTAPAAVSVNGKAQNDGFAVYISAENQIKNVAASDYVLGVLGAHCDKNTPEQSLKAQAVCAYTLALYYTNHSGDKNYDLEDIYDGYADIFEQKEKWGNDYTATLNRFTKAVNEVKMQYLSYQNAPVLALCHTASSGKTENAKDILGEDFPYLVSVESVGDLYYPSLETKTTLPVQRLKTIVSSFGTPSENADVKLDKTAAGAVKTATVYGVTIKGEELKNALGLASLCFSISVNEKEATVTTLGCGSLLGLSRNGADYMAQKGASYTEILSNYFKDCTLVKKE